MVVEANAGTQCPACGTPVSRERWSEGLCPSCVLSLALRDSAVEEELLAGDEEAPTLQFGARETFAEGEIQGERYRDRAAAAA